MIRKIYYLRNQSVELFRLHLHGMTWEASLQNDYSRMVGSPDILISHINPYLEKSEVLDHVLELHMKAWQGLRPLTEIATQRNIPVVLSGHVHWGRGVVQTSTTNFVNASTTKPNMRGCSAEKDALLAVTAPVMIDYDVSSRTIVGLSCPSHGDKIDLVE